MSDVDVLITLDNEVDVLDLRCRFLASFKGGKLLSKQR